MLQEWSKPTRPSPVMFLTGFFDLIKESFGYLVIFIAITFFRKMGDNQAEMDKFQTSSYLIGIMAAIVLLKFNKIFGWFFTRFWVEGNKIILTKGIFVKQRIELPLAKIQTVQIQQNIVHRITNTCSVSMDTAGSNQAEFVIDALKMAHAHALQNWVKSQKEAIGSISSKEPEGLEGAVPVFRMQALDFMKLCVSENHLKSFAIIVFFLLEKVADISERLGFDSKEYISAQAKSFKLGIELAISIFIIGFLIALVFSIVQVTIRYYGFTLRQTGSVHELNWGLFTRHRKLIPFQKVEFITWWSNWLRRKMGVCEMRMHSLADPVTAQKLQVQLPVTNGEMHKQLTQSYIYQMPHEGNIQPGGIQKAYLYRKVLLIGLPISLFAGALVWWFAGLYCLFVPLWLLYYAGSEYGFYRNFRIWINNDALEIQQGIWGRKNMVVHLQRMLHVSIRTSPWQRRHGYANLDLHLPGTVWTIPFLKTEQAQYWADYLTLKMEEESHG